jgi:hypothetical protein
LYKVALVGKALETRSAGRDDGDLGHGKHAMRCRTSPMTTISANVWFIPGF